ncbi:hypothetical protein TWF694_003256 [Orbilia ellipsospora]|uniref:Uncharacterized protein n=1 Tax=Orbilia ellipsospora TaxID=2528407 RepID=A0AAV9X129_9PEZI
MEAGPSSSTSKNAAGQPADTASAPDYSDISPADAIKEIDEILSTEGKLNASIKDLAEFDLWLKGFLYSKGWWTPQPPENFIMGDWDNPQTFTSIFHGSIFEKPGTESSKSASKSSSIPPTTTSFSKLSLDQDRRIPGRPTTAEFLNPPKIDLTKLRGSIPTLYLGISTAEHTLGSLIVPGYDIPPHLLPWRDYCHRLRNYHLQAQPYIYIPGIFPPGAYPPGFPMGIFPPGISPPGGFPPGPYPDGAFPRGFLPPNVLRPGEKYKLPVLWDFAPVPPSQPAGGPYAGNPLSCFRVLPFNIADPRTLEDVLPEGLPPLFDRDLTDFERYIGVTPEVDKIFEPKLPRQNPDGTFKMSSEQLEKRLETIQVQLEGHKWNVENRYVGPGALLWHMGPQHVLGFYDLQEKLETEWQEHVKKHGFLDLDPNKPVKFTEEEKLALYKKWLAAPDGSDKDEISNEKHSEEAGNPGGDTESEGQSEPELERDPFFNDEDYALDEAISEEESESNEEGEETQEETPTEGESQAETQKQKKKHCKGGFYLQDFDEEYIENLMAQLPPISPTLEAEMLEEVRPAFEKLAKEAEAKQAAREEKKKQIEEQRHPKFIGPMPQMVVDGKPKRVSMANLIEANDGKNPFTPQPQPSPNKATPKKATPKKGASKKNVPSPQTPIPTVKKGRVSILTLRAEKRQMTDAKKNEPEKEALKDTSKSGPSRNRVDKGKADH